MLTLKNRTGSISKPGFLAKAVRDGGFDYAGVGDTPIGVIVEKVQKDVACKIQTDGSIDIFIGKYVAADQPVRSIFATDGAVRGSAVPVGPESEYTMVGRTLESGGGMVRVLINISPIIDASSGGSVPAGGTTSQVLAKASATDYDTGWVTAAGGTVTAVTGSNGIASSGGTTPNITFDGTSLPVATTTLLSTAGILAVAGAEEELYTVSNIPLSIFDNDSGWTSNAGTVISVSGSGAIASTGGTTPIISFDGASLPIDGGALLADDYILVVNSGTTGRHLISSIALGEFNNNEGWADGTVTSVVGGYGITSSGGTDPSIAFDATELDIVSAGMSASDHILVTNGATSERWLISTIPLSFFNNDSGWTSNTGTVTNVNASGNENGITLTSSGGSNPNIALGGTLAISNADWSGTDLSVLNGGTGLSTVGTNRILTGNGVAPLTSEANLIFDGSTLSVTGGGYFSGDVGIGDASPSYKLDVNGTGRYTGILSLNHELQLNSADAIIRLGNGSNAGPHGIHFYDSDNTVGISEVYRTTPETLYWEDSTEADLMSLNKSGNLAVTGAITGASLAVTGEVTAYASDRRLKHNIKKIPNPLEKLMEIEGVSFEWRKGVEELGFIPSHKEEWGFIAQNFGRVIRNGTAPAPFDIDHETGKSISGNNYITTIPEKSLPLVIEAIKELYTMFKEFKN